MIYSLVTTVHVTIPVTIQYITTVKLNKYLTTIFAQHNISCVCVSFVRQFIYSFVHQDKRKS